MIIDPHTYAEGFIQEDEVKKSARARGEEIGAIDTTCGTGAYLKHLAHILSAQSVVEIGTSITSTFAFTFSDVAIGKESIVTVLI